MLRRKLLARLGLLVVGFVTGAVVSIMLLQSVLRDLEAAQRDAETTTECIRNLRAAISEIETHIQDQVAGKATPDQPLIDANAKKLAQSLERLGHESIVRDPHSDGAASFSRLQDLAPTLLAAVTGDSRSPIDATAISAVAVALQSEASDFDRIAGRRIANDQSTLSRHLRVLIVGLTIAALIITNIAIFVLVRTAYMILRPVDLLIVGSRELAKEHFDYRVSVVQNDEFAELAAAYNSLAGQLAANEQRKVEALRQLAVTLNHELNNVINVIELQLRLLNRHSGDPTLAVRMNEIHQNLERMATTIASLRNVRRIVLTDYLPGETMLDLARCITADVPASPQVVSTGGHPPT